jgi:hypothetical protein
MDWFKSGGSMKELTQRTIRCPLEECAATVMVRTDPEGYPSRRHLDGDGLLVAAVDVMGSAGEACLFHRPGAARVIHLRCRGEPVPFAGSRVRQTVPAGVERRRARCSRAGTLYIRRQRWTGIGPTDAEADGDAAVVVLQPLKA